MRYYVEVGDRSYCVELGAGEVIVDGCPVRAELEAIPGTTLRHLLIDGRSHTLHAEQTNGKGAWELHIDGHRLAVEALDERTRAIRAMTAKTGTALGPKPVRAPMPGLVVRIEVEPGQAIEAGDGVAIIEAMKMENELRAEGPGVVSRVLVAAGKAVEKGEILVEFDALERESPQAGAADPS